VDLPATAQRPRRPQPSDSELKARRSARRRKVWRERAIGAAMVIPALAFFVLKVTIPVILAIYLSLTDWNGFTPYPNFIGLDNYARLLDDHRVVGAFVFTAMLAIIVTVVVNVIGIALAVLINKPGRLNSLFRVIFFYPHMISSLVIGFLWAALLSTRGVVNSFLRSAEQSTLPFLSDPTWARWSVIMVIVWGTFGVHVVLYLAGLQSIPAELYEAATVDGANAWQKFRNVTVPMLAPMVTLNLVLVLIGTLKTYDLVLALTDGGPAGSTQTVAYRILRNSFVQNDLGFGAAQSVALMVIVGTASIAVVLLRRRSEERVAR
jgi:multiple sugar transport system permease protein/raffinose/stachyose/melibiose transport system permease protein